ncbi:peptide MFS transporter [Phenylobacterium deserti]|uniref:MFS transporter n=1 Tax=Phenylobacterium deserti TaxID=1914756 RepID=A0A328ASW6_9CAUL|nr:peptide MFS transporter [Phenylobacterium deserti]RAK56776.1 MFS transporter [Phenylobacterium deserti]
MNLIVLIGIAITLLTGAPVLIQLLRNHPRGLIVLFFAEMWERFSYYGMRGLLIFYLTQHLLFDDSVASAQYGSYTSLVYLLPLLGGILADRYLGTRKAVAFGAILLVAGHLAMGVEGRPATQNLTYAGQSYPVVSEGRMESRDVRVMIGGQPYEFAATETGGLSIKNLPATATLPAELPQGSFSLESKADPFGQTAFYLAISLIIMGVGFLKPNISTMVGQLYPQGDPRRDSGFTLYYYGINLGSFWASILCGLLGETLGWWAGFGLAGIGMAAGLVVFVLGKKHLLGKGEPPNPELLRKPFLGPVNREWLIYGAGILGVIPIWWLVQHHKVVGTALSISTILAFVFIAYVIAVICKTWAERQRMMLAVVLIIGAVIFWTLFEQAGSSLNLFAARNVQLMGMSAAQTQSFNAGWILIFAPVFAALWAGLAARGRDPDPTFKFGLALLQVGLGFMIVVWGASFADAQYRLPLILLALLYLFHTTGELCLSPVGLSQITKLSIPAVVSFMMAVWFLATSIAQYVGGIIAGHASTATVGGQVLDPRAALESSLTVFNQLGLWGMGLGVGFLILSRFIKGWSHGADDHGHHAQPEPIAPTVDGELLGVSPKAVRDERDS